MVTDDSVILGFYSLWCKECAVSLAVIISSVANTMCAQRQELKTSTVTAEALSVLVFLLLVQPIVSTSGQNLNQ